MKLMYLNCACGLRMFQSAVQIQIQINFLFVATLVTKRILSSILYFICIFVLSCENKVYFFLKKIHEFHAFTSYTYTYNL